MESDAERVEQLSETITCGFFHSDGSKPSVLREASPENTDALLCLTDNDQDNIIAALVVCALEFHRIILKIADSDYEKICAELKLDNLFVPDMQIGRSLVDLIETDEQMGKTAKVRGDLRFFSFRSDRDCAGRVSQLEFDDAVRVVAATRNDRSFLPAGTCR